MGAIRTEQSNIMFLNLKEGKFVRKTEAKEAGGGIRKRTYLNPQTGSSETVFEEYFDQVSGKMTDCRIDTPDFGVKFIKAKLEDQNGEVVQIQINFGDANQVKKSAKSFIQKIPGLDITKEMTIIPYKFKDEEKSREKGRDIMIEGMNIFQDDTKIKNAYTKDNPAGVPAAEKVVKMGEEKWDFTKVNEFLYDKLFEFTQKFTDDDLPF